MTASTTKRISDKVYHRQMEYSSTGDAKDSAKRWKAKGYLTRIIWGATSKAGNYHSGKYWILWTSKK